VSIEKEAPACLRIIFVAVENEMIQVFRREWAKPERERFNPSAEVMLEAARTQLGIAFHLERREMEVLVVDAAEK
jgi:hypothetical protein